VRDEFSFGRILTRTIGDVMIEDERESVLVQLEAEAEEEALASAEEDCAEEEEER
jgi:hypothetical protein